MHCTRPQTHTNPIAIDSLQGLHIGESKLYTHIIQIISVAIQQGTIWPRLHGDSDPDPDPDWLPLH